jgi:hypothetical protein
MATPQLVHTLPPVMARSGAVVVLQEYAAHTLAGGGCTQARRARRQQQRQHPGDSACGRRTHLLDCSSLRDMVTASLVELRAAVCGVASECKK